MISLYTFVSTKIHGLDFTGGKINSRLRLEDERHFSDHCVEKGTLHQNHEKAMLLIVR